MRWFLSLLVLFALTMSARATEPAPHILVDQFGYLPQLEKRAIIRDPVKGFDSARSFTPGSRYAVINVRTGQTVYEGAPIAWAKGRVDESSGDRVWWFDFTPVTQAGSYVVRDVERRVDSDRFDISPTVYRQVLQDAFKAYYYQRAGFEKREPYVQRGYADRASHLGEGQDPEAQRYDAKGNLSTARDLRGGWYDAGDYNQYTSWTANYISQLLASYVENPNVWTDAMGIPESGNGVPDVLDEVLWGLAWLERMQNPDGSMLSVLGRAEGSPPSKASGPSLYGTENTSATVTAAGTFAMAADVFRGVPSLRSETARFADRSARAWIWANANPTVKFYNNDEGQGTKGLAAGQQEVEADRLAKKRLIAATQVYGLTRDPALIRQIDRLYSRVGIDASTANGFEGELGFAMLHFAKMDGVPAKLAGRIRADYARSMEAHNGWQAVEGGHDAYGAFTDGYWWGSNGTKSRRGSVYTQAVVGGVDTGRPAIRSLNAASHYLHYLHGVNPLGLVYLTNMDHAGAERSVSTLYHAWFIDGSKDFDSTRTSRFGPAPGLLVGGANDSYARDDCCKTQCGGYGDRICKRARISPPEGQPPAKSYGEFNDGWPLNSWSVTENSLGYQTDYIRLLSKFAK